MASVFFVCQCTCQPLYEKQTLKWTKDQRKIRRNSLPHRISSFEGGRELLLTELSLAAYLLTLLLAIPKHSSISHTDRTAIYLSTHFILSREIIPISNNNYYKPYLTRALGNFNYRLRARVTGISFRVLMPEVINITYLDQITNCFLTLIGSNYESLTDIIKFQLRICN